MRTVKSMLAIGLGTLLVGSVSAEPVFRKPPEPVRPGTPSPKVEPKPIPICDVDLAIGRVTITKIASGSSTVRITVETINQGQSSWSSGANQQSLSIIARNGRTGAEFRDKWPMATYAEPGTGLVRLTGNISDAFDRSKLGGSLRVFIGYEPDIMIDGNDCNDDRDLSNNRKQIDSDRISAFMNSSELSLSF